MAEGIAATIERYVLNGTDEDLKRLLKISELAAERARAAIQRAGVRAGWSAIECCCGPLGALPVLADAVGPSGRVVGIDVNQAAIDRARSIMETLGVINVTVVGGELHTTSPAALGAPFDVAFSRQFLLHQPDPARTLRCIADLLRPGGVLIAQEPFRSPSWRSHPDISHLSAHWELVYESIERAGTPRRAVEDLPRCARAAGFDVIAMSGSMLVLPPEVGLPIAMANVAAVRERAEALGVATELQVNEIMSGLVAAMKTKNSYDWVASPVVSIWRSGNRIPRRHPASREMRPRV